MFEMIFFGTCSGTEPMKDMHHCAWAIKKDDGYYWFDAGENCSRTAHLMGENLKNVKNIFISHPHSDHIGGLMNLILTIRKLFVRDKELREEPLGLFVPKMDVWKYLKLYIETGDSNVESRFKINAEEIDDGLVYEDENIRVEAFSNKHMEHAFGNEKISYSFRIAIDGKVIVYSGDVKNLDEVDKVVGEGCDFLIMETGHHVMDDIIAYSETHNVDTLLFNHHGRYIIGNREEAEEKAQASSKKTIILKDKMRLMVK